MERQDPVAISHTCRRGRERGKKGGKRGFKEGGYKRVVREGRQLDESYDGRRRRYGIWREVKMRNAPVGKKGKREGRGEEIGLLP